MIIDVKKLTNSQRDQLINLVKLYFEEIENEVLDDKSAIEYINNIEKQLEKYLTLHFLIAENGSSIVGFLIGNTQYNYNSEDCSFILELYVSNENRLKGIGKKLVEEFENLSKDVIYLTSYIDAEIFYIALGYTTSNTTDEDNGNKIFKKTRN